ncbi:flagellar hook-associated protein FlgK [Oribacterium sp. HCP28S3_H8]|uniref:flagellar hook-associated protein FlgK n=1 Tax=Oribacterium sp. HCP28S3_H8 TaxID=3438945 RepID=UPI003F892DDC
MIRATFAGFQTALTAMQANSKKLDVTSQNLANMNVEGYTRQKLETSGLNYENPVSFYMNENDVNVGFGVSMDKVSQLRDQFLDKQYRQQNASASYNESISSSVSALTQFLDETKVDGIAASFDNVQTALTTMQDPSKVNDPVYESELRSRMAATANQLNSAARQIQTEEANEFHKIDGTGTSENGAIQEINDYIRQIGDLNVKIKKNELLGNSALELKDQRNLLLDKLSAYVPIETSTFSETYEINGVTRLKTMNYDADGKATTKSSYPEDLRVELVYTDAANREQRLTLVNGALGGESIPPKNVGKVVLKSGSESSPIGSELTFTGSENTSSDPLKSDAAPQSMTTDNRSVRFTGGSLQASLDMLASSDADTLKTGTFYGYDYYMDRLDDLAGKFAENFNTINMLGRNYADQDLRTINDASKAYAKSRTDDGQGNSYLLLVNRGTNDPANAETGNNIRAINISIAKNWTNNHTHIGIKGDSTTDTVLNMLQSMTDAQPDLDQKSYGDYMNNISTVLANDGFSNKSALSANDAVRTAINQSRDQLSGVSMDEEAANMMTYASSYNAAAKLMQTLDDTLKTLLNIAG